MSGSLSTDGRSRRADEKRQSRRAHILETALDVFSERGYHQARVSDIIDAAGIARGTFYLYFESKSAIFLELLDGLLRQLRENIVGVDTDAKAPPVEEQLAGTVSRLLDAVLSNRRLTTIIVRQAVGIDADVDRMLGEFYGNLRAFIVRSLAQGQALGLVRPLDTEVAAFCILGTIKHVMEQHVGPGPEAPIAIDRLARAILDFNLRGVLRPVTA